MEGEEMEDSDGGEDQDEHEEMEEPSLLARLRRLPIVNLPSEQDSDQDDNSNIRADGCPYRFQYLCDFLPW